MSNKAKEAGNTGVDIQERFALHPELAPTHSLETRFKR